MKKILFYIFIIGCLTGCGIFGHSSSQTGCPTAAFGAERINAYYSRQKAAKHATAKGDPVTGKKTSLKKGIRTGEVEKPAKLTKDQKEKLKKQQAEDKALERQLKRDEKLAKKSQSAPY